MDDPTQAPLEGSEPPSEAATGAARVDGAAGPIEGAALPAAPAAPEPDIQRGLLNWLGITLGGGVLSVLFGHAEGGLLFAGAGTFALAQASDAAAALQRYRTFVHTQFARGSAHGVLVRAVARSFVPLCGAVLYAALGAYAWVGESGRTNAFAAWWCLAAVLVSLALAFRPVADGVMRVCFRGTPGRTRRLTARLVVLALMLPVPARLMFPALLEQLRSTRTPLADPLGLVLQLAGEVSIALAGVGLFVRRDWPATLERLGIVMPRPSHLLVALAGVAAAIGLNAVTEQVEMRWLHALWLQDAEVTKLIAGSLPVWASIVLGVSAGVGEEVMVRGALQPRLGVLLSSLVFACGHVQYSWFGMLTVGLLGVLLGTIRRRTNTSTVVIVHVLYDIFAAVST